MKIATKIANKVKSLELGKSNAMKGITLTTSKNKEGRLDLILRSNEAICMITNADTLSDSSYKLIPGVMYNIKPVIGKKISATMNSTAQVLGGTYDKCADMIETVVSEYQK